MQPALKTDYDTLTTRPPEWYLARHLRRHGLGRSRGGGRLARFRQISRYKRVSFRDIIENRLDPIFRSEFCYYVWNVDVLCVYCGRRLAKGEVTRDHITPRAGGGDSSPDNLAPSCRLCNRAKGDRSLLHWLAVGGVGPRGR